MTVTQEPMSQELLTANGEHYAGIKEIIKQSGALEKFPIKYIEGMSYSYESELSTGSAKFRQMYEVCTTTGQTTAYETETLKAVTKEAVIDRMESLATTAFDRLASRIKSASKEIRNTFVKGVLAGSGTAGEIKGLSSRVLDTQKVVATANIVDDVEAILGKVVGDNIVLLMSNTNARKFSRAAKQEKGPIQWIAKEGQLGMMVAFYGNAEIITVEDEYLPEAPDTPYIYALHLSEDDGVCLLQPKDGNDLYVQPKDTSFPGKGVLIEFIGTLACFSPKAIAAVVTEPAEPVIP